MSAAAAAAVTSSNIYLLKLKLISIDNCNASCMLGDSTMHIGNIDYSQPKLGFEGVPELERYDSCVKLCANIIL